MNRLAKIRLSLGFNEFLLFLFLLTLPLVAASLISVFSQDTFIFQGIQKTVLFQAVIFLLFFIFFFFLRKYSFFKKSLSFKGITLSTVWKSLAPAVAIFFIGAGAAFLLVTLASYLPLSSGLRAWIQAPNPGLIEIFDQIKSSNALYTLILFLFITVIGPVYEEILFRGFLQNSFALLFRNSFLEILITALLFALMHIFSAANTLFSFCVGIVLSQQKKKSNNLHIPICIHSIINCLGVLFGIFLEFIIEKKG